MSRMKKDQKILKSKNDFINKPKKTKEQKGNYRKRWSKLHSLALNSKHRRIQKFQEKSVDDYFLKKVCSISKPYET